MYKNYLMVSLRNLKKHFSYSFINIFGFTVGLACTLVIGLWVHQEYSYDKHFKEADKIYRIGVNFYNIGDMAVGPGVLREKLLEYPDVEFTSSVSRKGHEINCIINGKEVTVPHGFKATKDFFQIFTHEFLYGHPKNALNDPNAVVLTADAAQKIFGRTDVINQTLNLKEDDRTYKITGVIDGTKPSHIPANMWFSSQLTSSTNWTSASRYQYVKMKNRDVSRLEVILDEILKEIKDKYAPSQTLEEYKTSGQYKFIPMNLTDIHLKSFLRFEPSPTQDEKTVDIFAIIAILILALASINFINISTARASTRAKEVGIRKSLGTTRSELIIQFILESVIVCLISITLAIVVGEFFLKLFQSITGLKLLETLFGEPSQYLVIYSGTIVLGTLAGIYPALYLTRFKPVRVLKGIVEIKENGLVRNGLVLFQFTISICLLIVSGFIFLQLSYMENKDLGFEVENVMVIDNLNKIPAHTDYFKEQLEKKSYINVISINNRIPASFNTVSVTSVVNEEKEEFWLQQFSGDEKLIECMGFRILEGRNFSKNMQSDSSAIIINEAAVRELGLKDPINKTLGASLYRIIGVVSDFNYESLKKEVEPIMIRLDYKDKTKMTIKYAGNKSEQLIADVKSLWSGFDSEEEVDYYFLDESFASLVEEESVLSKAVLVFTVLAMFISCLGLYGLSIFTAEQKTKEIGIRRVLGASTGSILKLLSQNFAKPIILALIIAAPFAFIASQRWLEDYAYRIEIGWLPFLFSGVLALSLGLITISWQSLRVIHKNPVESLRAE